MTRQDKPREKALEILRRVEEGEFADGLMDEARREFKALDVAFIHELVYGTLRNRSLLDWTLNLFAERPIRTDVWTQDILRLGAYQIMFLDKVPDRAAVHTSVSLAKEFGQKDRFVNGLLRNLARSLDTLRRPDHKDAVQRLSVLYSHPDWIVRRWLSRFGREAVEPLLSENNRPAPLIIRTNMLRTTREELKASLESQGVEARETAYSPLGIELFSSPALHSLNAYREGLFMVQDQAAQLIGMMLAPKPEEAVLDACAAPGGKATHLAEMMQDRGRVTALDVDTDRLEKVRENSRRLGITIISPVKADAARYQDGVYDKILIDAPCSGLGLLRRHPDGRWTKSEKNIRERQSIQQKILENCAGLLKPGGALVYATCTTEPEENEEVINGFLAGHPEFGLDDPRPFLPASAAKLADGKGFFRTYPYAPEMDGFFGARVVKRYPGKE